MSVGKSVRLFLADGTPGGLLTAEIMNWSGHVVAAPRSELKSLLRRTEVGRTGIYILLGDDPESLGGQLAYIGEGDDIGQRLRAHNRSEEQGGKDFWNRAVVLTSKDANVTKAHARYLESRLIHLAKAARRVSLVNGTTPATMPLPEADLSDMEYFIEQAKIVLPVLGVNLIRAVVGPRVTSDETTASTVLTSPRFVARLKKENITAHAEEVDGEFTVLAGSLARAAWIGSKEHSSYAGLHARLVEEAVLVPIGDGQHLTFAQSHVFASPSAAAGVITGRNANGRLVWMVEETGMTYADWQQQGIDDGEVEA